MDLDRSSTKQLDCFGFQARFAELAAASDETEQHSLLQQHLKSCKSCAAKNAHYDVILQTLRNQPKHSMPKILKRPFAYFKLPWMSRWEHLPWYVRTSIETAAIILVILIGISSVPKL